MNMQKTATALSSLTVGLLIASLSQGAQEANSGVLNKGTQAPDSKASQVSAENEGVKTERVFNNFKVTVYAPSNVDASRLLSGVSISSTAGVSAMANANEISSAIERILTSDYPGKPLFVSIENMNQKANPKPAATSDSVDLYKADYWWNRYVGYLGAIYDYNYDVNTVACFAHNTYGTWYPSYELNDIWYYLGNINSTASGAMYATGPDNLKGCRWEGLEPANQGDFVIYMFN